MPYRLGVAQMQYLMREQSRCGPHSRRVALPPRVITLSSYLARRAGRGIFAVLLVRRGCGRACPPRAALAECGGAGLGGQARTRSRARRLAGPRTSRLPHQAQSAWK